jgi:hypothetical protein
MAVRSSNADPSPRVQVPSAQADRPRWNHVGILAAIGFIAGVAWPRLAGVRVGPSVPESSSPPLPSASALATPVTPAGSSATAAPEIAAPAAPSVSARQVPLGAGATASSTVVVGHGSISSCKTAEAESLKASECGSLAGLDAIVLPRLRKLSACPAATAASGKLHLAVHVDFVHGVVSADLGHGRNPAEADALIACVRANLAGVNPAALTHDKPRYTVSYSVTFVPPEGPAPADSSAPGASAPAEPPAVPAVVTAPSRPDGIAQVEWDVAIVRDAPKTGKVVARLQRGASVRVGTQSDGWVPVRYGDNYTSEGWIYRAAIGR